MRDLWKLMWCTAGGLGLFPKAPGTWGSLQPLAILLVAGHFGITQGWLMGILLAVVIASSVTTIVLAPWYTEHFGKHDPSQVVSDEIAGQSIALMGMAWLEPTQPTIWISLAIASFVLFRIFDIWKPSIIGTCQSLQGGVGVLMDDVVAGILSGIIVLGITLLIH